MKKFVFSITIVLLTLTQASLVSTNQDIITLSTAKNFLNTFFGNKEEPMVKNDSSHIEEDKTFSKKDGLEEIWFDLLKNAGVSEKEIILAKNMRSVISDLDAVNFQEDVYIKIHGEYKKLTTPNLFSNCVLHDKVPGLDIDIPFLVVSDYRTIREVLTQDQIRALLCHEIGHYLLGHSKEVAFNVTSRKKMAQIEFDADKKALEIMLKNGMNPQDLADAIQNITSTVYRIADVDIIAILENIDNHPQPTDRVAEIQRLASVMW